MPQSHDYISGLQLYYYSMKKNIKNGTNSEDKVSESNTDEDTNIQNEGLHSEIPTNDNNIKSINSEKTIRKSNSNVKIEDYDLIVNSLRF